MELDFWNKIERGVVEGRITEIYKRDFRGARVYLTKDEVYKVQIRSPSYQQVSFYQDLVQEAEVLGYLDGKRSVVRLRHTILEDEYVAIVLERINGTNLAKYHFKGGLAVIKCMLGMISVTLRLSFSGVVHGDLAIHNFIIDQKGDIFISDFGRARKVGVTKALIGNTFFKLDRNDFPVLGAFARFIEFRLPIKYRAFYRGMLKLSPYTDNLNLDEYK